MSKVTLDVLASKIDALHEDIKDLKSDCKLNTEFRLKANGVVGGVAFVCTALGATIMMIVQKFWGVK